MSILRDVTRSSTRPSNLGQPAPVGGAGVTPIELTTLIAALGSAADSANYATASFTLAANQLGLFMALSCKTGGPDNPSIGGSLGGTWTEIDNIVVDADRTLRLFRSLQATPRTGTLQLNHATVHESAMWTVLGLTGIDLSGTNGAGAIVQAKKAAVVAASALAISDQAPFASGNNLGLGFVARDVNAAITAVAPYTQVSQAGVTAANARIQAASALGVNNPGWTFGVCDAAAIAIEVKIA